MKDITQVRSASVATILLGGWLMLSPIWISITGWALASVIAVGAFMALMGLIQMFTDNFLPSVLVILSVIWLAISAYAFDVSSSVVWNQVVSAIVGFGLATWDSFEADHVHQHRLQSM